MRKWKAGSKPGAKKIGVGKIKKEELPKKDSKMRKRKYLV